MASPSTTFGVRPDLGLEPDDPVAVDDDVVVAAEPGDRPAHREVRGVVDVELVDLADGGGADADRDGPLPDQRREALALGHRQGLRVAHAGDAVAAGLHDHGRRDDRAAGRCDPDLVDARDAGQALVPEAALVAEGRDDDGHRAQG